MAAYRNGRFCGALDSSKEVNLWDIFQWKVLQAPSRLWKRPKAIRPLESVNQIRRLTQSGDFICWLSHASFLIQLGGKRILIDPVFGNLPFYKRQIEFPYPAPTLGKIDYLLVSHAHYDHLDIPSIRAVAPHHSKAILPSGMSRLLRKVNPSIETTELHWYEEFNHEGLTITLVPARHWSRRGVFDTNRSLWGGYLLSYNGKTIYFAGDTAEGTHFEEIGSRYDIDIALLPIGAYDPVSIMRANHLNPQQAYDAFKQLRAKKMIPMHYGTFKLSDEPLDEPLMWMKEIQQKHLEDIVILRSGEVFFV